MMFFAEIEKYILRYIQNFKGPQRAKQFWKKNRAGRLTLSDFKTTKLQSSKQCGTGINTDLQTAEWNGGMTSNPHMHSQMIFNKDAWPVNAERTVFSTNDAGKLYIHLQKNEAGPLPSSIHEN